MAAAPRSTLISGVTDRSALAISRSSRGHIERRHAALKSHQSSSSPPSFSARRPSSSRGVSERDNPQTTAAGNYHHHSDADPKLVASHGCGHNSTIRPRLLVFSFPPLHLTTLRSLASNLGLSSVLTDTSLL